MAIYLAALSIFEKGLSVLKYMLAKPKADSQGYFGRDL